MAVSAKSRGTVEITVTADDGKGGTVSASFDAKVKSAPRVTSDLDEAFALEIGVPGVLIMSDLFIDDDGDALSVTAGSSDDDIATATISSDRSTLTVAGVSAGAATIRVIAQDPDDNQAVYSFDVSVTAAPQIVVLIPPQEKESQPQKQTSTPKPKPEPEPEQKGLQIVVSTAPSVGSTLADVSGLVEGTSRDVSLSGAFADVDGDALTITASSDYTNVATVSVSSDSSSLTLTGVSSGSAVITVVAQDKDGNQASQTFNVEVTDTAPQQPQPQTITVVQQPTAVPAKDKDTQDTETEETPEQETETPDTETEETETFDALARYDTNGDGNIDKSELNQAVDDFFEKKIITYSEFLEVFLAHQASAS